MNDNALMRSLLVWGVPFAIVLGVLGYETDWGRGMAPDAVTTQLPPPPPVKVALLPEYKIVGGVEARKDTVDRVLFNPTRRPAPPAAPTNTAAGSRQKGLYVLTGTTMSGGLATAFLREVKGGKSHTVHKGERLDGDLVAEVTPDYVVLSGQGESEELQLKIASGPKTTIQVAPPAPATAAQPGIRPAGAGGTGQPVPGAAPPRPALPNATNPNAQRAGGTASVSEILAERRRAARAAAAAASAGTARPQ